MQFKLDENFGRSIQALFAARGHNCHTVHDEQLSSAPDPRVLQAACAEDRILVTMDHEFGNVLQYPPEQTPGIALINPPGQVSLALLTMLIHELLQAVSTEQICGKLWIVEPGRIREHQEP